MPVSAYFATGLMFTRREQMAILDKRIGLATTTLIECYFGAGC